MAPRIIDIANKAGVAKATVSAVLNDKADRIGISQSTRLRVLQIARQLGYQPNAAAKALATRRTGHIGFILSDTVEDGWANVYYAHCLLGVERECRRRGYGLTISTYNLSNLDTFVFPPKVGQRGVDGLILADCVGAEVLARFREFGIPLVCIGDDVESSEHICAVTSDFVGHHLQGIRYLAGLGHRRIGFHIPDRRRARELAEKLIDITDRDPQTRHCEVTLMMTAGRAAGYREADSVMDLWLRFPDDTRPTALFGTYQVILAFMKNLRKRGLRCPDDVSLISGYDAPFCALAEPAVTSVRQDMAGLGERAAAMILDHVEGERELEPGSHPWEGVSELVVRETCTSPRSKP